MRHEFSEGGGKVRELAWIAVPFLVYLALLQRLWFNAPIGDDFDAILRGTLDLKDAGSPGEWLRLFLMQHNEHRIVVTRAAAWAMAGLGGSIDFRLLVLLGNLALAGVVVLLWAEFCEAAGAPLVAAAGFVVCQMTFYEGALLSMAAISNIGVVAFAFACLFFALRSGGMSLAWSLLFGLLAAGSQGNGLFALPLAAVGCALWGSRRRAWVFVAVTLLLWVLYFATYQRPPHLASPLEALQHPIDAARLFLVVVGSIAPGLWPASALGALLLAALAWLALGRFWNQRPVAALWIAFILVSAAAAAAGRVGFGVFYASRYAINSSCLAAIVLLLIAAPRGWPVTSRRLVFVAAAIVSLALSWFTWAKADAYSFQGRLLAKGVPAAASVSFDPYFGVMHPDPASAARTLIRSEARGLYRPRQVLIQGREPVALPEAPALQRVAGHLDVVRAAGRRVIATGWSDITAEVPGRTVATWAPASPVETRFTVTERTDVAIHTRDPRLLFSGFQWDAGYATDDEARQAAAALCVVVQAPGHPTTALLGAERACSATGRKP